MNIETAKKAIYGSPNNPIKIGNIEIPCYVLEDEKRVLVQSGMIKALGMSRGSSGGTSGDRLAKFVDGKYLKPFIDNDLITVTQNPLKFIATNGKLAYGYEANILAEICFAVDEADRKGKLQKQQSHIVERCRILMKGFAVVGINALVDEATGYQEIRDKLALQKILEAYISPDLMKWQKRFYDEYYIQLFKLRGWEWKGRKINPPPYVGKLTNDIIYERLAPGVLDELKRINPPDEETGRRKHKHHQWLTPSVGHPALDRHIIGVIALMKAASNWGRFKRSLVRAFPKIGEQTEMDLD